MFADLMLRIVGIGAIGVLLDVLMPEGETNKYIKSVFSLVTVLMLISPFSGGIDKVDFDALFDIEITNSSTNVDKGFIKDFYVDKYSIYESEISTYFEQKYGDSIGVKISFVESCPEKIDVVYLYLKKSVIEDGFENKYSIESAKDFVRKKLGVQEDQIIIRYG